VAYENLVQDGRNDHLLPGSRHDALEAVGESQNVHFRVARRICFGSGSGCRNYDLRLLCRASNYVGRQRSLSSGLAIRVLRRIQLAGNRRIDVRKWHRAAGSARSGRSFPLRLFMVRRLFGSVPGLPVADVHQERGKRLSEVSTCHWD